MTTGTLWANFTTITYTATEKSCGSAPLGELNVMSHKLSSTLVWSLYVSWSTLNCFKKKKITFGLYSRFVFKYLARIYTFHVHKTLPVRRVGQILNLIKGRVSDPLHTVAVSRSRTEKWLSSILCVRVWERWSRVFGLNVIRLWGPARRAPQSGSGPPPLASEGSDALP